MEQQPVQVEQQENKGEKFLDFNYRDRTFHIMKQGTPFPDGGEFVKLSVIDPITKQSLGSFDGGLVKDKKQRTHYQAWGVGRDVYRDSEEYVPGLMREAIAQMVGRGKINEWKSSTSLSADSMYMYEKLLQRAQEKDSRFIAKRTSSWTRMFQSLQYTLLSK